MNNYKADFIFIWYCFTIAKFDQTLENYYKNTFVVLEKDSNSWIEKNPYIEILERALKNVETELNRINIEQVYLDTLIKRKVR